MIRLPDAARQLAREGQESAGKLVEHRQLEANGTRGDPLNLGVDKGASAL